MTRSQPERRPDPEPEDPAPSDTAVDLSVVRARSRTGDTRIAGALWTVAALIVLAIAKPWALGPPGQEIVGRPAPASTAVASPLPTVDRSTDGLAAPVCLGPGSWRLASLEMWRTQDVRVWRAIEPIASATGPLDPAIPSVPVVAAELVALGWCAPAYGPDKPVGPVSVVAWFVVGASAIELDLLQVLPADGMTPMAALYVPWAACDPSAPCPSFFTRRIAQPWPTGRVLFRYVDEGAARYAWFGADVEILGPSGPASPSPEP